MKVNDIRKKYVQFFESNKHKYLASSPLIPNNDPTLLFVNAGMVQFKDEFTGKSNPADKRVVTIQKCVRAGGKHNDLENVGFTSRHHTFFEMMGNFSFGDYFKKEAISMAWEFLTVELKIPKDKLYVTAHHTDQEAADIWHEQEKVPRDRIFFRGDKDNFWEMGEVGPCGPCSEIFYDHGPQNADPNADTSECILDDEDRYVEIWNLVFMQYEKFKEDGEVKRRPLPKPSVDTGAGLERLAAVLQGVYNNFDTDCFSGIIGHIEKLSKKKYQDHPQWMRVVADHARAATMLLSDGVIPSNEGRGYVLRRIIRRAIRHLDLLDVSDIVFYKLTTDVFESLGELYVDAKKNQDFIEKYLKLEEEGFRKTLASGLKLLEKQIAQIKKSGKDTLPGKEAFLLYDTHGFPIDLTEMILRENDLKIDAKGFEAAMLAQKERSKKAGDFSSQVDNSKDFYAIKEAKGDTEFLGYTQTNAEAKLTGTVDLGEYTALVFDKTPFYAEGGGQEGDSGAVYAGDKKVAEILDTKKPVDGVFSHIAKLDGELKLGETFELRVNKQTRDLSKANHTATHLLQAALIQTLGNHIKQAGSSVGPERLRFDFTHPQGLTRDEVKTVESLVNAEIKKNTAVSAKLMTKDEAMAAGATALFGEKYGAEVRVIDVPGFSIELCGGTHVAATGEIGYFKILSEGSLASGVRRIEAVTNAGVYDYVDKKLDTLEQLEIQFNAKDARLLEKLNQLQENHAQSLKKIKELEEKIQSANAGKLFEGVTEFGDGQVFKHIPAGEEDNIRKLGDLFIDKYQNGVVLITQEKGDKLAVLLKTFRNNKAVNCSDILKEAMGAFGGKGGGKPDMAQGSVGSADKDAFTKMVVSKF